MVGSSFFNSEQFMPHGMCYLWQSDVLWTTVISDVFTAFAYFSFTIAFIVFVHKRKDLQYSWFFVLAGSIVFFACGVSHILAAVVIWEPIYGVLAVVKALTAVSSVAAGIAIWFVVPFFLNLPSQADLQKAKDKSDEYSRELERLNDTLEHQVLERTHELSATNQELNEQVNQYSRVQSELKRLKNFMQNIIDSMPSVLVGVDENMKITHWNAKAEKVVGVDADHALKQSLDLVSPIWNIDNYIVETAIKSKEQYVKSNRARMDEGIKIFEDITVYPLHASSNQGAVIRVDDVTAQTRLQETMVQSEKMLSVGGLAAGMAHEINNPLAGMVQTANVMKKRLTDKELPVNINAADELGISMSNIYDYMSNRGILRMLNAITDSGQRIAEIVENMLSFARKNEEITSSHSVVELIDKTLDLSATDYDLKKHYDFKDIAIIKEYSPDLEKIPCDGGKIRQVLLNILRNGAEAMQDAGTVNPHFIVRAYISKPERLMTIEIEDNGPGMDDEARKRAFEPFFTTKAIGVGTGLGLSVSYFIITENHGGRLFFESILGKGTKFVVQLPMRGKSKK